MIGMILAGGSGSRLWPFSRSMTPKQFLNLGSTHESLLQETLQRISPLVSADETYIVGSAGHEHELKHQLEQSLPDFPPENLLLEPKGLNTAPAILWGLSRICSQEKNEPVVILPSDHLIRNREKFLEQLRRGGKLAEEGWIVIFGIKPDRPETGYGYIKLAEPLETGRRVDRFVEKPDLETAGKFVESGEYCWNAGIFIAKPEVLLREYKKLCPEMHGLFFENDRPCQELEQREFIEGVFDQISPESFDYAILEKSRKVAVLPVDIEWNDLGSWESIYLKSAKDKNGNVTRGNVILQDSENCLIFSDKRLVTCIGARNLIVIETSDALLVCDLKRSQDVKKLVETLKREERFEYKFHSTVMRPWGKYAVLYEGQSYQIKKLVVSPGKELSRRRHFHRNEHWMVVSGTAEVVRDGKTFHLTENESAYIPKTVFYQLRNPGRIPLEIIEVQQGSYLKDDDVELARES